MSKGTTQSPTEGLAPVSAGHMTKGVLVTTEKTRAARICENAGTTHGPSGEQCDRGMEMSFGKSSTHGQRCLCQSQNTKLFEEKLDRLSVSLWVG